MSSADGVWQAGGYGRSYAGVFDRPARVLGLVGVGPAPDAKDVEIGVPRTWLEVAM
jgi:hypothetical protein